jgi:hypothetical protein
LGAADIAKVPVVLGKVSVFVPATAFACNTMAPEVLPSKFITPVVDAIFTPLDPSIITVMVNP